MSYAFRWPLRLNYGDGSAIPASAPVYQPSGEESFMNAIRITGIVLIVLGLAGFFTGGFSFTKDTTKANIGPIQLSVQEKESVNIPQWLSIGAIVLGAVVLVMGSRKS
jgi:drug/metabolite transporter (DMT)-like permease